MQSSFYRRTLPKFIFALVALTVGVFLSRGDATAGTGPGPFDATTDVTLSGTGAGANANTQFLLGIETGDYNFSAVVNATPTAATVTPGPGHPSFNGATHPALGDVIGTLDSNSTLGLTNNLCTNAATPDFTFLNSTVDINDTIDPVPQSATNVGSGGTLDNMWSDNGSSTTPPGADPPWNAAWPNLEPGEASNGLPAQVEEYPSYLNILFDPDYPLTPGANAVQPLARYAGADNVVGTSVTLNLVIFAPDALANAFQPPHPFADLKGIGYTSIAVLNNPAAEAAPSSITDFCSPLISDANITGMSRLNPCNGVVNPSCDTPPEISDPIPGANNKARYANPGAAGTYFWVSFHQSLRDADGDGKENAFDTCPTDFDTLDHRTGAGETDGDGVAPPCDPNDASGTDNLDGDAWLNRGDNCPQNVNDTQVETELTTAYNVAAPRSGSRTDSIGDACDAQPAVANGQFETTVSVEAKCIGGTDGDGDGFCAATSPASLNDPNDANASVTPEDYDLVFPMPIAHSGSGATPPQAFSCTPVQSCPGAGQPYQVCNDGLDNDGDGLVDILDQGPGSSTCRPKGLPTHPGFPACPATGCAADFDGDGFTNEAEINIGTDVLGRCDIGNAGDTVPSTDWPIDFTSGGTPFSTDIITLSDLTSFLAPTRHLDRRPGVVGYDARWDVVPGPTIIGPEPNNWIQLDDLTSMLAGATGLPPMTSGAKVFNGAACTAHPTYGD